MILTRERRLRRRCSASLPAGAAAAFGLRLLNPHYTGPLIRLRESSGGTEKDFYPTLGGDFPVGSATDFANGASLFVTTWHDQSGTGNDASQATAANQPQLVLNASPNGRPSINWDGSNRFLNIASPNVMGGVAGATIFVTASWANVVRTDNDTLFEFGTTAPVVQSWIDYTTGGIWRALTSASGTNTASSSSSGPTLGSFYAMTLNYTGAAAVLRANGTQVATAAQTGNLQAANAAMIGRRLDIATAVHVGNISELIAYSAAGGLSASQISAVESNARAYYGF